MSSIEWDPVIVLCYIVYTQACSLLVELINLEDHFKHNTGLYAIDHVQSLFFEGKST